MEALDKEIEKLKREKPVYKEILCFYQNLLRLFKEVKGKIKPSFEISEGDFNKRIDNGFPVYKWDEALYSEDELKKCLKIFLDFLPEDKTKKLNQISSIIERDNFTISPILKEFSTKNLTYFKQMEQFEEETVKLLEVFSYLVLKPIVEEELLKFQKKLEKIKWNEAFCPFCGFSPSYALIEQEEGFKYLNCSLCGHMWRFPRLLCINCKKELKEYFYDPDDQTCRIELCNECKNYIKVFDARGNIYGYPPLVKDLITLHMDVIAKEKGFTKESGSLFF